MQQALGGNFLLPLVIFNILLLMSNCKILGQQNIEKHEKMMPDSDTKIISVNDQPKVISEAYTWINNLNKKEVSEKLLIEELQTALKKEDEKINKINTKVKQNKVEIYQLQIAICNLLTEICSKNQNRCPPCPWMTTTPPLITTQPSENISRPDPDPTGNCGEPKAPKYGYLRKNLTTLNAHVFLYCEDDFELIGNKEMICTALWNEIENTYQYSWAPLMSAICRKKGEHLSSKPGTMPPLIQNSTTIPIKINTEKKENLSICMEPKKVGRCKAALPRYYFDIDKKECTKFTYGGCDGNRNNFIKKIDCIKLCA